MSFFSRLSPLRAFGDLRAFLRSRKPYEVGFMALSIAVTWTVIVVFSADTDGIEKEYVEPDIVYVQSYATNRSDAEIIEQQKIDLPKEQARKKVLTDAQEKRRQEFKRLDDKLKSWGI